MIVNIKKSSIVPLIAAFLLVSLFLTLRLYHLTSSLLFFNDMGRDYLALQAIVKEHKIPLLGPQTSAFSFNQSAVYYYLLLPVYLLSGQSAFASEYTGIIWYLAFFLGALMYFWPQPNKRTSVLLVFFLLTIHPEVIRQNRFIWNPSFTPPLLLASLYLHHLLRQKINRLRLVLFSLTSTLSIALTYASVPLIALLYISLWLKHPRRFSIILSGILALLFWNLPTLVFEIRHHFALTRLLFAGQHLPQTAVTLANKWFAVQKFIINFPQTSFVPYLLLAVLAILFMLFQLGRFKSSADNSAGYYFKLFLLLVILTIMLPINLESHYIFGIISLGFFVISLLPLKTTAPLIITLALVWLSPAKLLPQFLPAVRTVADLNQCYRRFCAAHPDPLYVSMQSGILPYHNAPEHRYFMKQNGCNVKDIETTQNQSPIMAVVLDNSTYQHGKTAYHELTLFGPSQVIETVNCTPKLGIVMLQAKPGQ